MKKNSVALLGCGVWGSAFVRAIIDFTPIVFWDKNESVAKTTAHNLGGEYCTELTKAISHANIIIIGVNCNGFSNVMSQLVDYKDKIIVWLTKGFEPISKQPLCHVAAHILGKNARYAAISGPSFATEVNARLPSALAVCANHFDDAVILQSTLHSRYLRLYIEKDMIGLCIGGAIKNVIAIATGIADAMKLGENARAALITRGLEEMAIICDALGGQRSSLFGLSGVGDLVLTCSSNLSRNRRLGIAIGSRPDHLLTTEDMHSLQKETCEGAVAIPSILSYVTPYLLDIPIITAVSRILEGKESATTALETLLSRPARHVSH